MTERYILQLYWIDFIFEDNLSLPFCLFVKTDFSDFFGRIRKLSFYILKGDTEMTFSNKREQLKENVISIVRKPGTIKEKFEQYRHLKQTQTILKRPPKDFNNGTWLFVSLGFTIVDECLSRPAEDMPRFFSQYQLAIDMELQRFRDEYNAVTKQTKGEWECYTIARLKQREIRKRYAELHPDLVEANALVISIAALRKAGIFNQELEKRCDKVTHHYDMRIVANLPVVEKLIEKMEG